jgi:hypothetical protein
LIFCLFAVRNSEIILTGLVMSDSLVGSLCVKLIAISITSQTNNKNAPLHNVQNKSLHGICSSVFLITVTCTLILGNVLENTCSHEDRFLVNSPLLGHATIDAAVFSMRSAPSNSRITGRCNPFLSNGSVNTLPRKR